MLFFGPPQRPRQFTYKPRFYTPPEESEEEEKRIRFEGRFLKRDRSVQRQKRDFLFLVCYLNLPPGRVEDVKRDKFFIH